MNTKNLLLCLGLLSGSLYCKAQNGLDSLIIEKYYVANADDAAAADKDAVAAGYAAGALPVGSVTYRIYASMKQGYKFEGLYGNIPHPFKLNTTTSFYNNSAGGNTSTNWNRNAIKNTTGNVLALDSWFSVGGAASNAYGVLQREDSSAWGANLVSVLAGSVLQNKGTAIPLTVKDGYYYSGAAPANLPAPPSVTFVGLTTELDVFGDGSTIGKSFVSTNGSVASLNGTVGPTPSNRVLLGQFTTDGIFCYEINLQIGTPGGGTQQYVSKSPTGAEIQIPSMMGCVPTSISTGTQKSPELANTSFSVYPNPAKDQVTIDIKANSKTDANHYVVYDITGAELMRKNLGSVLENRKETLDISSLPTGMYFLELVLDGVRSTQKMLKN
jgi:hypothetical protein